MPIFAEKETVMRMDIKKAIKAQGLTVKEVAERMEITPIGLSQHINGNPSVQVLERIAAAAGCTVRDFFEDSHDFTALIDHCGILYRCNTLEELEALISRIKASAVLEVKEKE